MTEEIYVHYSLQEINNEIEAITSNIIQTTQKYSYFPNRYFSRSYVDTLSNLHSQQYKIKLSDIIENPLQIIKEDIFKYFVLELLVKPQIQKTFSQSSESSGETQQTKQSQEIKTTQIEQQEYEKYLDIEIRLSNIKTEVLFLNLLELIELKYINPQQSKSKSKKSRSEKPQVSYDKPGVIIKKIDQNQEKKLYEIQIRDINDPFEPFIQKFPIKDILKFLQEYKEQNKFKNETILLNTLVKYFKQEYQTDFQFVKQQKTKIKEFKSFLVIIGLQAFLTIVLFFITILYYNRIYELNKETLIILYVGISLIYVLLFVITTLTVNNLYKKFGLFLSVNEVKTDINDQILNKIIEDTIDANINRKLKNERLTGLTSNSFVFVNLVKKLPNNETLQNDIKNFELKLEDKIPDVFISAEVYEKNLKDVIEKIDPKVEIKIYQQGVRLNDLLDRLFENVLVPFYNPLTRGYETMYSYMIRLFMFLEKIVSLENIQYKIINDQKEETVVNFLNIFSFDTETFFKIMLIEKALFVDLQLCLNQNNFLYFHTISSVFYMKYQAPDYYNKILEQIYNFWNKLGIISFINEKYKNNNFQNLNSIISKFFSKLYEQKGQEETEKLKQKKLKEDYESYFECYVICLILNSLKNSLVENQVEFFIEEFFYIIYNYYHFKKLNQNPVVTFTTYKKIQDETENLKEIQIEKQEKFEFKLSYLSLYRSIFIFTTVFFLFSFLVPTSTFFLVSYFSGTNAHLVLDREYQIIIISSVFFITMVILFSFTLRLFTVLQRNVKGNMLSILSPFQNEKMLISNINSYYESVLYFKDFVLPYFFLQNLKYFGFFIKTAMLVYLLKRDIQISVPEYIDEQLLAIFEDFFKKRVSLYVNKPKITDLIYNFDGIDISLSRK